MVHSGSRRKNMFDAKEDHGLRSQIDLHGNKFVFLCDF